MVKGLVMLNWVILHWIEVLGWNGGNIIYLLYYIIIRLQLSCDFYGLHMVAVICALLTIDVALSALF